MDVPKSYSAGMINKRIVTNSVKDLQPFFKNLKVKILKSNARGTPIIGFKFTWKPEKTKKWIDNKYQKRKAKELPDWFGKEYVEKEKEIDTETNDALQKRLEDLRNKRPQNK